MSQCDGHRHQLLGLAGGVSEHQSLVTGSAGVHAQGDVGALAVELHVDFTRVGVKRDPVDRVTDVTKDLADHLSIAVIITGSRGGDFSGDLHVVGGAKGLAGNP